MRKNYIAAGVLSAVLGLAACGGGYNEANGFNQPDPSGNACQSARDTGNCTIRGLRWERLSTPSNYETVQFACLGEDGVFLGQSTGLTVSTFDPNCGASSQVVGTKAKLTALTRQVTYGEQYVVVLVQSIAGRMQVDCTDVRVYPHNSTLAYGCEAPSYSHSHTKPPGGATAGSVIVGTTDASWSWYCKKVNEQFGFLWFQECT